MTDDNVGVFGWLGFVIINFTAWGIIGVSSSINWGFGFAFCLAYAGILMGLACCLDRCAGTRYKPFQNLLWVLACWFVFILGLYLTFNVIGPAFDEQSANPFNGGGGGSSWVDPSVELPSLLPNGSSQALKDWAAGTDWRSQRVPSYVEFEGYVFFSGMAPEFLSNTTGDQILLRSNGTDTALVTPVLTGASSFTPLNSKVYFLAQGLGSSSNDALWSLNASGASAAEADLVKDFQGVHSSYTSLSALTAEGGKLYLKGEYSCPEQWTRTIYESDGTDAGTVNLRGDPCPGAPTPGPGPTPGPDPDTKPTAQLWSVLLVADLPMIAIASAVLALKKMPGLFMNIYIGTGIGVILIYLIAVVDTETIPTFLKWFITLYTAAAYLSIAFASLLAKQLPPLVEAMKDWIVVIAGVGFFVVIHIDLEIPFTSEAWAWVVYAFLALVHMLIASAVSRTIPMVLGAITTFVVAWKISRELVRLMFGDSLGQMEMLTLLGILAFQGIGIILAAIAYASKRDEVDALVRDSLLRCLRRRKVEQREQIVETNA